MFPMKAIANVTFARAKYLVLIRKTPTTSFTPNQVRLLIYFTKRNSPVHIEIDMESNESSDESSDDDFVASEVFNQSELSDMIRECGSRTFIFTF